MNVYRMPTYGIYHIQGSMMKIYHNTQYIPLSLEERSAYIEKAHLHDEDSDVFERGNSIIFGKSKVSLILPSRQTKKREMLYNAGTKMYMIYSQDTVTVRSLYRKP